MKNINWYPGHMAAAKRMLQEHIKIIDVVIHLLDARLPGSSRNPDLDKLATGKKQIIILNKTDLADPQKTAAWLAYYRAQGFYATDLAAVKGKKGELINLIRQACKQEVEKAAAKGIKKTLRVLIAGVPNVGKSTLINMLAGSARAKTGDRPGVTRGKQWITVDDYLELLDSPGLLWPKLDDQRGARLLAFTGAINDETLDKENLALALLEELLVQYPDLLTNRYGIEINENTTALELFEGICRKRGMLLKGNQPDYARGATHILDEVRGGKIGRITLESPPQEADHG